MITESVSTRKTPQRIGRSSSLRITIAKMAMMPPSVRLPVSPMKICAGNELNHRKPAVAPMKAAAKTTSSSAPGMNMTLKYAAIPMWEEM